MNTPYSVGLPSLMAVYGFIHAFELRIKEKKPLFSVDRFAICIHSAYIENRGLTKEFVQKSKDNISSPATTDDWQCDFEVSLILQCQSTEELNGTDIFKSLPKRLARGSVKIPIDNIDKLRSYSCPVDAIKAISNQQGQWLSLHSEVELQDIQSVIDALKSDSSLSLNSTGYHQLEPPKERTHAFRCYKHAFVESILSLVKTTTVARETNLHEVFWQYRYEEYGPTVTTRNPHETAYTPGL